MKKNHSFIYHYAVLVCILGFVIVAGFVVRTFLPTRLPGKVIYEVKLGNVYSEKACEATVKKELAEALVAVEARAASEYNDKFITLLTVLALFGIAWPLVVAFAQYKFNERELDKIQVAEKNASEAQTKAKESSNNANEASIRAAEALGNADQALANANEACANATQAIDKATAATGDATSALNKANEASANANKALEEAKETDLLVKNLADLFKSSSSDQWEMLSLVYTKSAIRMNKSGEDTKFPSTLNFNRLMNVWCKCFKIQFGQLNKLNTSNADIIKNYLSNISPEEKPDDMSPINKAVVKSIIKSLDSFIERNQEQPVRESLDDLKKMAMALLDAYKKLVPDGSPEDLIV